MALSLVFRTSGRRFLTRFLSTDTSATSNPNPVRDLNHAIRSLFKERDPEAIVAQFKHLSSTSLHFRCKGEIYLAIVRRLLAADRTDSISDILEAQKLTPGITYEGFALRIISLYGNAKMADNAYNTFLQLPSLQCPRTILSFNALLAAFCDAGEPERAIRTFESITTPSKEEGGGGGGGGGMVIVPDLYSYNTVIHAMCKMGDVEKALGLLQVMEEKGIDSNVITYTTILNGYYGIDRIDDAEKVWEMMRTKNCHPDVKCFNAKVRALSLKGRMFEATELVDVMRNEGLEPDGYTYTSLVMGQCGSGNLESAKKVFDEMCERGCLPNAGTYTAILPRLCESGELDLAVKLCNESIQRKLAVSPEVLQGVVDKLAEESRIEDAKKLVQFAWSSPRKSIHGRLKMPMACSTS